jgi:glycosyltransferase involved in cell wall biosynthesis
MNYLRRKFGFSSGKFIAEPVKKIRFRLWRFNENRRIKTFLQQDKLNDKNRREILLQISQFNYKPLISIVMPVYNIDEKWLRLCIESVTNQLYENWEFCIADDCSPSLHIKKVLDEYAAKDSRFKVIYRTENGHISKASNSALELTTGEFTALLDHDDELSEDALFEVIKQLNKTPNADFIYSDQDKIDEKGKRSNPIFKPDWNLQLFYSMNFTNHLSVYRTEVLQKIGGFRIGFEGSQDYDLALRFIEQIDEKNIVHIPKILYHWRTIRGSLALGSDEKSYAHEIAENALREHFKRKNTKAKVEKGFLNYHRVVYDLPEDVSFEVVSAEKFAEIKSKCNIIILVEKHIQNVTNEALTELVRFAIQENIGAVGGKILNRDSTIDNCGIVDGEFVNRDFPSDFAGNLSVGRVIQNVDAVCGVLAIRRELFEKCGKEAKNLIELCSILQAASYQIVFTPYAEFIKNG